MDFSSNAELQPGLTVRRLDINLNKGFERHWFGGDAFRTAHFNALSMSFPLGEQLFIDSVKAAAALLPSNSGYDALRSQCQDFSAQEATHRYVHAKFNAVLEKQGLKNHLESRIWARFKKYEHKVGPRHQLALTAAYEHHTAVFAHATLAYPALLDSATPEMQKLWRWHAMEEAEHKAVAMDLYHALRGNTYWRRRWFLVASVQFVIDTTRQTVNNLWHDGTLFKPSTWWSAATFFFGRPSKGGGWVWLTALPTLAYLKADFHPSQHDSRALVQGYAQAHAADWTVVR
jgi:uncharacterized protein